MRLDTLLAVTVALALTPACAEPKEIAEEDAPCEEYDNQPCETDDGEVGTQWCVTGDDGDDGEWGECIAESVEGSTPLVLVFDGSAVRYHHSREVFDLDARRRVITDWPTATTPWLVLDRGGDRRIEDGRELFGSMTPLVAGGTAEDGFQALAELDSNGDGRIDAGDEAWPRLELWSDHDGDRRSHAGELRSLESLGVLALSLGYHVDRRCDGRGNCEVERASFLYRDGDGHQRIGEVVDVHLRHR